MIAARYSKANLFQKDLYICQLPSNITFIGTGWSVEQTGLGLDVCGVSDIPEKDLLALGVTEELPFTLPEDDYHWEWSKEGSKHSPESHSASKLM